MLEKKLGQAYRGSSPLASPMASPSTSPSTAPIGCEECSSPVALENSKPGAYRRRNISSATALPDLDSCGQRLQISANTVANRIKCAAPAPLHGASPSQRVSAKDRVHGDLQRFKGDSESQPGRETACANLQANLDSVLTQL
mmetsp:Transcript_49707/g.82495  ORF Transcript_49707/g.82495 Transcript_49707/m.82495 type:complete len:142 (-) Transcript_49707:137-562(-)